jgi:ribosomal protein S18 acetylase RimI-like enzyme
VFELSDAAIEQIVFAMEDQDTRSVVDLDTGEVSPADGKDGELFAPAPVWSSRDGFRLMEDFLGSIRMPSARRELGLALGRGRGVFKAFKAVLAAYPDLERAFRDYKLRAMRRAIEIWYDDLREARGLARLGPEPEETDDLISSDLEVLLVGLTEAGALLDPLIEAAESEALEALPAALLDFEFNRLRTELDSAAEGYCAFVDDGEGGALAAAAAIRTSTGDRSLGRIVFVAVRRGFRRMGLGTALLRRLGSKFAAEGTTLLLLDCPVMPAEFAERLEILGFRPYGARSIARFE